MLHQTISKVLKLLSAVLLARLIVTVEEAFKPILQIDKRLCWSDSTTTLQWIKNEEREWKSFVQKPVDEIRKLAEPQTWSYVRSEDNPADIPTRHLSYQLKISGGGSEMTVPLSF